MGSESVPRGISFLDHTADVGVEVHASSLPDLFILAALGMASLVYGADMAAEDDTPVAGPTPPTAPAPLAAGERASAGAPVRRVLSLSAEDVPTLLRAWLRPLLGWLETEGLALRAARFDELTGTRLEAVVDLAPDTREPIREIKGVTLHGLVAEHRGAEWTGRVIFDV
ncbi:MAG: archease [Gemmatimonadetes bacterium]|nr:archease [Gemmatimonadota bacterium]